MITPDWAKDEEPTKRKAKKAKSPASVPAKKERGK